MGGKSDASSKEAKRARAEEEARQQRIRQGTADINRIFDGGPQMTAIKPTGGAFDFGGGEYYNADGTRRTDKVTGFDNEAVFTRGGETKGQFTDDFFRSIRDGFTNYAMPQLQQQRDQAARDLTFDLDRKGQLASSVRGQKTGELQKLFDINEQQVRDQALAHENTARNNVESARADLIGMLNATGDNQQAVNSALSRATILTQPQAYSPLGQLFTDFTAELGNQAARERAAAASGGRYQPAFNTGLFGGTGRVDVRR